MNINPKNIVLISREGEELLQILQETPLETLNFSVFANQLQKNIKPIDLDLISKKLEEESSRLPESEIENIARLRNIVLDLKSLKELVNIITNKIVRINFFDSFYLSKSIEINPFYVYFKLG